MHSCIVLSLSEFPIAISCSIYSEAAPTEMESLKSIISQQKSCKIEKSDTSLDFPNNGNITRVSENVFETPIHRIGVSGGTAAFYNLKYMKSSDSRDNKTANHYIGKDLSRASDEIEFYEDILVVQSKRYESEVMRSFLPNLLEFTFEYIGVLSAPEAGIETTGDDSDPNNTRHLLVLRNLYDGSKKLRLLDFKIGQFTASSGWKKKSSFRAAKQKALDFFTNSEVEGYRLEGFDGPPASIVSRDETIENAIDFIDLKKKRKIMYQNMTGLEIFSYLIDLQESNYDMENLQHHISEEYFSAAEVSEIVLNEIVKRLSRLTVACNKVTIPQKWVGSSVAIGFDCNYMPARDNEQEIRSKVIVNIFDWGRSELNTPDKHDKLSVEEKIDRQTFWKYYVGGINHLSYVAASAYLNHFGNCTEWSTLHLTIRDYDAVSDDEYLGVIQVPLKDTPLEEHPLRHGKKGKLLFSVEWNPYPACSRFHGSWKVFIQQAKNLIVGDLTSSDPYCVVTALSNDGKLCFEQCTKVVSKTLDPIWEETFEIPLVKSDREVKLALDAGGIAYSKSLVSALENKIMCDRLKRQKKLKQFYGSVLESDIKEWENAICTAGKTD